MKKKINLISSYISPMTRTSWLKGHHNAAVKSGHEPVLWIRIRIRILKDPHHFGNLESHPDHPHQRKIGIWIRIKIHKLDPETDPEPGTDLH
jgi:hypothetical protein